VAEVATVRAVPELGRAASGPAVAASVRARVAGGAVRARARSWGSTAPSRCSSGSSGAESVRQLPTLRLFKIRMDLKRRKAPWRWRRRRRTVEH
jgi:hypothetical protein